MSAHPAWLGLVLGWLLGYRLHIFPFTGLLRGLQPDDAVRRADAVGVPPRSCRGSSFALLYAAIYARMIRASVLETMDEEYVRTARAKGAGEMQVLRAHVLRNAMLPVVTMVGMDIGAALGGVIFIETVFGLPGLGGMLRGAILEKDLPVILGVVTFTTIVILILNLRRRPAYAFIDPRVRMTQSSPARPRRRSAGRAPVGEPAASPIEAIVEAPADVIAVTSTRRRWSTSALRTPYVRPVAPAMLRQSSPLVSQRCQRRRNDVRRGRPRPVRDGQLVTDAGRAGHRRTHGVCGPSFESTTSLGSDVAVPFPSAFVAVTTTRACAPRPPAAAVYAAFVAPAMSPHAVPSVAQRRH